MTENRAKEIYKLLVDLLDEIKNDDDRYLCYHISGLDRAIFDIDFLLKSGDLHGKRN